jgi:hypothetical protein
MLKAELLRIGPAIAQHFVEPEIRVFGGEEQTRARLAGDGVNWRTECLPPIAPPTEHMCVARRSAHHSRSPEREMYSDGLRRA